MADPRRPAAPPHPPRVQDVAKEYARDVLPTGAPPPRPRAPAPTPAPQPTASHRIKELARDLGPAAQRVRDLAKDLAPAAQKAAVAARDLAKDLAQDVADGYRRSNRYVRLRAVVVASWVVLTLGTLFLACPSSGPVNALGAEAVLSESFLGTQLLVRNASDTLWTDVVLTLEGGWTATRRTVRPGDEVVMSVSQFTRDGAAAPRDLHPASVVIECSEGRVQAQLAPR
jgi:hypothetical protein